MYKLFSHKYLWNKLWQCLIADGGHFEHLHWIQNSRTSLISILLLYKYSSYDYRVIFFMSKCVYIILGHSVYAIFFNVHGSVHLKNILIYIQQDATLHSLFYLETALHVSGVTTTHHQEGKTTVSTASGICHIVTATCRYRGRVHSTLKPVPTLPR
jgi:hypothetical protein